MSRVLDDKIGGVGWDEILEYVCVMVLDKHREGTPTIKLADHSMPEGLKFRLNPLLQEHQATLLFGEGDTGKSWLAIYFCLLVCLGLCRLGMEAEPGNVLYLDYETDEDTLWERVDMICAGLNRQILCHGVSSEVTKNFVAVYQREHQVKYYDIRPLPVDQYQGHGPIVGRNNLKPGLR